MTGPFNPFAGRSRMPAAVPQVRVTAAEVWTALASREVWGEGSLDVLRRSRRWGDSGLTQAIDRLAGEGRVQRETSDTGRPLVRVLQRPAPVVTSPAVRQEEPADPVIAERAVADYLAEAPKARAPRAPKARPTPPAEAARPAPASGPKHPRFRVAFATYDAVLSFVDVARQRVTVRTLGEGAESRVLHASPSASRHLARYPLGTLLSIVAAPATGRILETCRPRNLATGKPAPLPRGIKGQAPACAAAATARRLASEVRHRGLVLAALARHPAGLMRGELEDETGVPSSTLSKAIRALAEEGKLARSPRGRYLLAPEVTL